MAHFPKTINLADILPQNPYKVYEKFTGKKFASSDG
jgi:hypothetical protein